MSFEVIHDVEKGIAALVDAEYGRALGPIATGEKAVEILDEFAGAHGIDPATIPTGELEARWKDFVVGITAPVAELDGEQITAGDVVAAGPGQAQAGAPEQAPADPTAAQETTGKEAEPVREVTTPANAEQAPAEPGNADEPVKPVTAPKPGFAICPTCSGWGEVVEGGVTKQCAVCAGTGEVPVEAHPEPGAPTA